jgi:hypothetical protein
VADVKIDVKIEAEFLAAAVQKPGVIDPDVLDCVQPEHFQVDSYRWLVKILQARSWKPPVWDFLDHETLSIKDPEERAKYRAQIWHLYNRPLTFLDDATEKFRAYIAYCIVNVSMRSALEGFAQTSRVDYLLEALGKGVSEARNAVQGRKLKVIDYADNYPERMSRRKQSRDNPNLNPRLMTGIRGLDVQFVIKAPMVVDFIAPFKRYKSIFLNAIGYAMLLQGFNVLHVTYENSEEMTMGRYDAMFSELNYNRISNLLLTQEEKDNLDRTFAWMKTWNNRLKIVKATAEETTVTEVESEVERFREREGWTPDVEVWDYLNIIAPSVRYKGEERREQKQIVWDLKRHAEKFNVAIFEASQANMAGVKADRLSLEHRGLSIDISRALDLCIAIDQTDDERAEGIIVLSPQFARDGLITIPEIVLDADLPRMSISRELHHLWSHATRINPYVVDKQGAPVV